MRSVVLKIEGNKTYVLNASGEFQSIKTKPSYKVGMEVQSTPSAVEHKRMVKRLQSVASVAACLAIFVYGAVFAQEWDKPAYSFYVDINPSVKFEVNSFNRIINHSALNEEGLAILGEIKPSGDIASTVESVIDLSKKQGYMASKEIDVTIVSNNDSDKAQVEKQIKKSNILESFSIKKITHDVEQTAIRKGVTPIRFTLANEAVKLNPDLTYEVAVKQSYDYLHDLVSGNAKYLPIN